eukprot:PITA_27832
MPKPVDEAAVEDQFPDEHLFAIAIQRTWYADVANYLVVGADMQIRRCVRQDKIFDILKACHDQPCGGHFTDRRTAHTVLQTGYYWPTIFKDAKKFVQACDNCQRAGHPSQSDEMPLKPQLVIEPFERWALDFVGPIYPPSNQKTYILVAAEYVTKWVEAEALPRATEESVIQFLLHLFVRRDWAIRLLEALWAYRTTWKSTTGYLPYQLMFGKQPIFPIEFEIETLRTAQEVGLDLTEAQTNRLQHINELDEIRLSALQHTALIQ